MFDLVGSTRVRKLSSGLSTLKKYQIAERGARMARRDDREYREYLRKEQRRQPGCPAREVVLDQPIQATSFGRAGQLLRSQLSTRSSNDLQPWVQFSRAAVEARTSGSNRRSVA